MAINKWRGIDSAPRDGTTILSDMGFIRYYRQDDVASAIETGWHTCDIHGWPIDLGEEAVEAMFWLPMDVLKQYEW